MYLQPTQKDKNFSKLYHEIVKNGFLTGLSSSAIRVYLVLLVYANYETGWSYPTVKTISRLSGVDKNRISKATKELDSFGLITKSRAGKRFEYKNYYRIVKHPKGLFGICPENTDKRRQIFRGKDGKFEPVPKNTDNDIPLNMDQGFPRSMESCVHPQMTDKK